MKNIILGILVMSASVSFAQTDGTPTHQLKKRFSVTKMTKVQPISGYVKRNSQAEVSSQNEEKSNLAIGVVSIENGIAYISLKSDPVEGKALPTNLPKAMEIDGQEIRFNYSILDVPVSKKSKHVMEIEVFDVSFSTRK